MDGDGLGDIVYVDHGKVMLWLNQSGNRWSDPIEIDGTPTVTDMDAVRLVDLLGTGIAGVLWSAEATSPGRPHLFFLDFTGGVKPYLMDEMNNHMGALTRVEYAPSTQFYLADQQRPETRWQTTLPFPVQVVARVEVIDEISRGKLTTEYRYHHGYWDGAEREFRGFGRVDQRDTEVFNDYHAAGLHPERRFDPVPTQSFSPPTETRTWFHQGPIGEEFGDWYEADYRNEYWPDDPEMLARPAELSAFLKDANIPRRVKRDAIRALRGRIVRTELYALDGTARQDRPYTVTEPLYSMREEQAPSDPADTSRMRIFFPHTLGQRVTQWERGQDPMTQLSFTGDYDELGQPRHQTQIACPRGWRGLDDMPGRPYLATLSRTVFAKPVTPEVYIIDRVAKTTTFEIVNDGSQRALDLRDVVADSPDLTVIAQALNYYDGDAFVGRGFGEVGDHGALVRTESLVLTEAIVREAYKSGDTVLAPAEVPPYLVPGGAPDWTAEYPQEFRDRLPPLAGYTFYPGDPEHERGYFVNTARQRYDFHGDPEGPRRGLLQGTRDPLGHDTTIGYDVFDLLPMLVIDPVGLVIEASYDLRVLQPREVTNPNGNRTHFAYTPLGLVQHTAAMGKPGEGLGDTDAVPGTQFEYNFLAFENSPPAVRQPVSVHTIRREHHVHDTDVPLPERAATIETIEYSDGFGRLLQTRTQAEDVTFGDAVFGGEVLPADQSVLPGDAVGCQRAPDDPLNVVVSGWQVYDNKGRVVEKFEPFFDRGFAYASPQGEQFGQKVTMFYDPRGKVIRTVNPDRSEQRVVFGVPGTIAVPDLTEPDVFEPTLWEAYTYDANDNAGRTHGTDGSADPTHLNTPASIEIDALGRTIKSVVRNRPNSTTDWFTTRSTYDIRGNLLTVTDTLGRKAFHYTYNLANKPLRIENTDAGVRRIVLDATGNEVERRDNKGALILQAFDLLQRPIRLWARDDIHSTMTLRERLVYGDGGNPAQDPEERAANRAQNRLGVLHEHYDEAGRLTLQTYDFKGNVLEKIRQVIRDEQILSVFDPPPPDWGVQAFRVDWRPLEGQDLSEHASNLLDVTEYRTSMTYDALNRMKTMRYPQDVDSGRQELRPVYNRAGTLARVELNGTTYVEHIAYSAKGQRSLIALGNGMMTRYAYDPHTFRLARMRTERYEKPVGTALTYHPTALNQPLQDFAYAYDFAGNILRIVDLTPGSGVQDNPEAALITDPALAAFVAAGDALVRGFEYDPLYRLTRATGRECRDIPRPRPWTDDPRCGFNSPNHGTPTQDNAPNLTTIYNEDYSYDPVGNMVSMAHRNNGFAWSRHFGMGGLTPGQWRDEWSSHLGTDEWLDSPGNRLTHVGDDAPTTPQTHFYDANGNLTQETTSRHFEWDHGDQMKAFRTQAGISEPSVYAHYLYDASGQRVKKLVCKQGGDLETTVYIDGLFEHHRWKRNGGGPGENNRFHVMDDQQRIALVRVGPTHPDDRGLAVQYHLGDHLGSNSLVADKDGSFINREEYTPYGETSFGSFAEKRYRFTGKERDAESGLFYYGQRYYASWLSRWASCDPIGEERGLNLYAYVRNAPLTRVDPTGRQDKEAVGLAGMLQDLADNLDLRKKRHWFR